MASIFVRKQSRICFLKIGVCTQRCRLNTPNRRGECSACEYEAVPSTGPKQSYSRPVRFSKQLCTPANPKRPVAEQEREPLRA